MGKTLVVPCCGLMLLIACESPTRTGDLLLSTSAAAPVHTVIGGGTSELPGFGEARISFVASVDGGGEASGQFQMYAATGDVIHHAIVTCLFVQENEAWVGIGITRSENPQFVGVQGLLRVVDNGEGAGAAADRRSSVVGAAGIGTKCNEQRSLSLVDWTHGNVNIR